jgi:hypothetical protein
MANIGMKYELANPMWYNVKSNVLNMMN